MIYHNEDYRRSGGETSGFFTQKIRSFPENKPIQYISGILKL